MKSPIISLHDIKYIFFKASCIDLNFSMNARRFHKNELCFKYLNINTNFTHIFFSHLFTFNETSGVNTF